MSGVAHPSRTSLPPPPQGWLAHGRERTKLMREALADSENRAQKALDRLLRDLRVEKS
jgi:hypothetical protein